MVARWFSAPLRRYHQRLQVRSLRRSFFFFQFSLRVYLLHLPHPIHHPLSTICIQMRTLLKTHRLRTAQISAISVVYVMRQNFTSLFWSYVQPSILRKEQDYGVQGLLFIRSEKKVEMMCLRGLGFLRKGGTSIFKMSQAFRLISNS